MAAAAETTATSAPVDRTEPRSARNVTVYSRHGFRTVNTSLLSTRSAPGPRTPNSPTTTPASTGKKITTYPSITRDMTPSGQDRPSRDGRGQIVTCESPDLSVDRPTMTIMAARPTIYDVALEAGVSASTVSRAYSRPGRVNAETARRIFLTAERLGYRWDRLHGHRTEEQSHRHAIGLLVA